MRSLIRVIGGILIDPVRLAKLSCFELHLFQLTSPCTRDANVEVRTLLFELEMML